MIITHPEKVLFPDDGITKGELAGYYDAIAPLGTAKIRGWIGEQTVYTIVPTEETLSLALPERRQLGPA